MCRTFNVLPKPGGLLDQPALIVEGMQMVVTAQAEAEERMRKRSEKKKSR